MVTAIYLIGLILVLGGIYLALRALGSSYLKFRGTRVITCPETKEPAAVKLDALRATAMEALGAPELRLRECTRWPERRNCGQECLQEIEKAPQDCLVLNILSRWYQGKTCVYCGKPLGEIHWAEHKPALRSPEGITVEWYEVSPEKVPAVLASHQPICWDCHIAQTFRKQFPDRVVDREWKAPVTRK